MGNKGDAATPQGAGTRGAGSRRAASALVGLVILGAAGASAQPAPQWVGS